MTAQVVFWASLLLLLYAYAGYPLVMRLWAQFRPRPVLRRRVEPFVSVLVAAHDEAASIGPRLDNLLGLDYPADRLEILVGSDGSNDGTAARARACARGRPVRVFEFRTRRGKPSVLNDLAARARGDLLLFADARQRYEQHALRALVAPFADGRVGGVGGALHIMGGASPFGGGASGRGRGATAIGAGASAYRRIDDAIRQDESWVDSTVGLSGAIYAIRAPLFEPLPADAVLDDVLTPMRVTRRGYRVVFEPTARAFDRAPASGEEEFTRKVRTLAGNLQLLAREPWLLNPLQNRLWFQTRSHKALRTAGPVLLVLLLGASLWLAPGSPYAVALFGQACFYGAAAAGWLLRDLQPASRLLGFPYTFCLFNAAAAVAIGRVLLRRQSVTWRKAGSLRPTPPAAG